MPTVRTELEIAAPSHIVRQRLLDFPDIQTWHSGFVKSVRKLDETAAGTTDGSTWTKGTRVHLGTSFGEFQATVEANEPGVFSWRGDPGFVYGVHTFEFNPSEKNVGGTRLVQKEDYLGWGSVMGSPWVLGWWVAGQYDQLNQDLKKACESKNGSL